MIYATKQVRILEDNAIKHITVQILIKFQIDFESLLSYHKSFINEYYNLFPNNE